MMRLGLKGFLMTCPTDSLRASCASGFTLLELMVAIAIFAFVGVMAYGGLNALLRQSDGLEASSRRLGEIQVALRVLGDDMFMLAPRPVRDALGGELPALSGGLDRDLPLAYTRFGSPNPLEQPRSGFERVVWRLDGERLLRGAWNPPDGRDPLQPDTARRVLDGVQALELRFIGEDDEPVAVWPPADGRPEALPKAVELRLLLRGVGEIQRLFPLVEGAAALSSAEQQNAQGTQAITPNPVLPIDPNVETFDP